LVELFQSLCEEAPAPPELVGVSGARSVLRTL